MSEKPLHRGRGGSSLSQSSHLSPHTVQHLLDTLADEVAQALARGESYTIPGVCTLSARTLAAKATSNLRAGTGDAAMGECVTPARRKIKCRPAKQLLAKVNSQLPQGMLPIVG